LDPANDAQRRFNRKLSGIRTVTTENVIGLWKLRFAILKRGIGTKLNLATNIIIATAMIHNICLLWNEPDPLEDGLEDMTEDDDDDSEGQPEEVVQAGVRAAGQARRDWLTQNFC
jgi:hypothetical protein